MALKRGLGKGFDSLLSTADLLSSDFDTTADEDEKVSDLRKIDIELIEPDPDQPRRYFDEEELNSLAASLKEHGMLQPIVVVPKGKKFTIVAGERRYRAAQIAGMDKLPAIVRTLSAQHRLEVSIIENVQREDLNPMEVATAYAKLRQQFNLSDQEISDRVKRSVPVVSNYMRLLKLPDEAKQAVAEGKISEGHARQILAIDDPKVQKHMLDEMLKHKWTVRQAENFVTAYKKTVKEGQSSVTVAKRATRAETPFTRSLAKRLGLKSKSVLQKKNAKGGQIIIKYKNDDEMAKITELLGGE